MAMKKIDRKKVKDAMPELPCDLPFSQLRDHLTEILSSAVDEIIRQLNEEENGQG